MVTKKSNPTKKSPDKQRAVVIGTIFNTLTMSDRHVNVAYLEELADNMIKWVNANKDALSLEEFLIEIGYYESSFDDWYEKCPALKHAREYCNTVFGVRRENGAIRRKFEPSTIHKVQGHFSRRWREQAKATAELKDSNDGKVVGTLKVVSEHYAPEDKNESGDNNKA